jgi:hypothetical protein
MPHKEQRAALGVRMHSGWGVLVAVSGGADALEVIDRRRIVITDPKIPGANQPYHYAASLELPESESYLANSAAVSQRLASAAVEEVVRELDGRCYRLVGSALLLASGRPLPPLAKILASHPLIHTAEGEFFRNAVRKACEDVKLPVTAIREQDLDSAAGHLQSRIFSLGRSIGPPWTKDHTNAALAAAMILAR